ncbi:MAG: lysine--tRNA ligase [Dehalococcoidia bacterium]|nr:lysine--tRNA ligase [Dehalococcoidia bacterium]
MAASERHQELRQQRLDKALRWRERGVDPYPPRAVRSHTASEAAQLADSPEPTTVTVAGRIVAMRVMGKLAFLDLRDGSGRIQAMLRADSFGADRFATLHDLDLGDFIAVSGQPMRTRKGEPSVDATDFTLLTKAIEPPPEKWHGLADVEQRYRQRYLDLMSNDGAREIFQLRSQVVSWIRRFMDERGYLEVETPILHNLAGGAAARPFVTHHNAVDRDLYLRVALELHLKRLVVGGLDRVYEIGRIFRNEGADTTHNPEFTMMEWYEAYADYTTMASMFEEIVSGVALDILGTTEVANPDGDVINLAPPWRRLTMRQGLIEYTGFDFEDYRDLEQLRGLFGERGLPLPPGAGWGKLVDEMVKQYVEPHLVQPTLLIDYPVELTPLAKRKPDNPSLVERFEPFVRNFEIGNAYTELNDPVDQRQRFEEQARLRAAGDEEAELIDEDFVRAIEYGLPPTGGAGLGIDRLVMVLSGQHSMREVILFPALRSEQTGGGI